MQLRYLAEKSSTVAWDSVWQRGAPLTCLSKKALQFQIFSAISWGVGALSMNAYRRKDDMVDVWIILRIR